MNTNLLYTEESYKIRGACFEVYKEKGCGFVEAVYQECLEIEFELQKLLYVPQPRLELAYKGRKLKSEFQPDFICFGKIVVKFESCLRVGRRAPLSSPQLLEGHRPQAWPAHQLRSPPRRGARKNCAMNHRSCTFINHGRHGRHGKGTDGSTLLIESHTAAGARASLENGFSIPCSPCIP